MKQIHQFKKGFVIFINKILKHSIYETRKYELSEGVNHRPRQFYLVLSRLLSNVIRMKKLENFASSAFLSEEVPA